MRLFKYYLLLVLAGLFAGGCSKLLEPENDNHDTFNRVYVDPAFAEGLLMNAYNKLPTAGFSFNDVATDDAVSNDKFNGYLRMATGQWSAKYNPVSIWNNANEAILYLNTFIPRIDTVTWSWSNEDINRMFKARLTGEAYALRGLFRYYLLQNIAGKSTSGKLLGIPLFDGFLNANTNFNLPRADFTGSVNAINADFDKAMQYLPMDFLNITAAAQLPPVFSTVNITDYNTVFGIVSNQRITKRIVMGLKARVALLAASPAFNANNDQALWVQAADAAAGVLAGINGITGIDPFGHIFFQAARVDAVKVTADQKEMLWRGPSSGLTNTLEKRIFPPGLNGNGEVNPTQNLVDAFPMKNGYPVNDPASTYNPASPYANRDPRLALYIVYNGAPMQGKPIKTALGGGTNAKDSIATSTRTGYYLRKLVREDIIFSASGSATTKKHYAVHMRYTELFLDYAEAANEAWGPTGVGTIASYSAKDVIAAIRKRAGITQPDAYLNSITTREAMRDLIRNERRLELCFEGFRFWDMRRWGLPLNMAAKGANIDINATSFQYVDVEPRVYQPYMQYAPLPEQEILKFPALEQNSGW
ncbi:MAG: RagB/SusD family nutrient uptake outer membrane protein [Bacteroidetes bacterium]|nr:RagB/SusD family nutrient uptake outer membrane protein [Bacteroidota bacterium]MCL6102629.1 RagB/SusD family nutrient uptake outer membrane protein [Bacteroidota bacterium]